MSLRLPQIGRLLRLAVAALFLLQTALAPLDALARTEPAAVVPLAQEPPPVDEVADEALDAALDEVPGAGPPVEAPETEPSPDIPDPLAPVEVTLATDDDLLRPGKTVRFEVRLWRYADAASDLTVRVELPDQLEMKEKQQDQLTWTLPASVGEQQEIVREFKVKWRKKLVDKSGAVVDIGVRVEGAGHSAIEQTLSLGSTETTAQEAEAIVGTPEAVQDGDGLVLEGAGGDVTVLAEPGAVEAGTVFRYTDLWRADAPQTEAEVLPTEIITAEAVSIDGAGPAEDEAALAAAGQAEGPIYLPLIETGATDEADVQAAAKPDPKQKADQKLEAKWVDDVLVYHTWHMDAVPVGQTAVAEHIQFQKKVKVRVDVSWLVDAGVDVGALDLWTRPDASQPWARVETKFHKKKNILTAKLSHFSDFGLGQGMSARREVLPSVSHLSSDLHTGAATVSVPIEAPAGLGGMSPRLSLNYSSGTVDDIDLSAGNVLDDNNNEYYSNYRAQAGTAGLGWGLGGVSYIGATDYSTLTGFEGHQYQLVLNGASTRITGGKAYPETFAKIDKSNVTHKRNNDGKGTLYFAGEWIITTPDGTRHYFGSTEDPRILDGNQRLTGFQYQSLIAGPTHWMVTKWYLRKSVDPLGNHIHYNYSWEMGRIGDGGKPCSSPGLPGSGLFQMQNYHRDVRLSEVLWSANEAHGPTSQMRVKLDYAPRGDYRIDGYESSDCKQVLYSTQRLDEVHVQVLDTGNNWKQLRRYELGYRDSESRPCDVNHTDDFSCYHSLLEDVTEHGMDDSVLNKQRFDYTRTGNQDHGQIYLNYAENGWGGTVKYEYERVSVHRCRLYDDYEIKENCETRSDRRWKVSLLTTDDGLGNEAERTFYYERALELRIDITNDEDGSTDHYLGHRYVRVMYRALNSTSVQKLEETWFYQYDGDLPSNAGQYLNPDPRVGRAKWFKIHRPKGSSGCPSRQPEQYGGYCRMSQTNTTWSAWRKDGSGNWVDADGDLDDDGDRDAGSHYGARPLWVRLDSEIVTTDGAADERFFHYEPDRQGNAQYGNVTKIEEGGYGSNRLRATVYNYYPNVNKHIVSLPGRTRIYGSGGDCHAEMRHVYGVWWNGDTNAVNSNVDKPFWTVPASTHLVRTEQALVGCGSTVIEKKSGQDNMHHPDWAVTRYAYDRYGNQTTVNQTGQDYGHDIVISTEYDSRYHLFPVRQWNPHKSGFEETAKYWGINLGGWGDGRLFWGAMGEHCGVNGVCTRQAYDEFGRATYRWDRIPTGTNWSDGINSFANAHTRWVYAMYGEVIEGEETNRNVITEWHAPRCKGNFVRRHYNGIGQLVQEQSSDQGWKINIDSCNPGINFREIDVNYEYDALGHQVRASVPHRINGNLPDMGWVNREAHWDEGYTSTSYDVLSRPTRSTAPNGQTTKYVYPVRASYAYLSGDGTHRMLSYQQTNELGQPRLVRNYRHSGGWQIDATVTLTHDLLDNLTRVDHAGGLGATTMEYDAASRKQEMNDPDLGLWTYDYDRQGHLTQQTDARGCATIMDYDPRLGRLTQKRFSTACPSNGSSYTTSYGYDAGHDSDNRSRGQLTSITRRYNGAEIYGKVLAYNEHGQLEKERVAIGGAPSVYEMQYGYDPYLRPNKLIYPDGDVVTTGFNGMGLPRWLISSALGTLAESASFTESGQLLKLRLTRGTDLWRWHSYYDWQGAIGNGNRRLAEIRVGTGDGSFDRLRLYHQYDAFGNLKRLDERFNNGSTNIHTFVYDHQNRVENAFGRIYHWLPTGNFWRFNGQRVTYDPAHPHAADKVNGVDRFDYDANGNMRRRDSQTLTWNHENHLASVAGGVSESYLYDDSGIRVKKTAGNVETFYPFPHYEVTETNTVAAASVGPQPAPAPDTLPEGLLDQPLPDHPALHAPVAEPAHAQCAVDVEVCDLPDLEDGPPDEIREVGELTNRVLLPLVNGDGSSVRAAATSATVQVTKYYFFNGQRVMMYNGGTYYLHGDHLGSNVLETGWDGTLRTQRQYFAYGAKRGGTGLNTDHYYTGQKQDGTGLMYYNARYYDPSIGQFVSPDTLVPDASRVMDYNRYAYVRGNPLRNIDPDGHNPISIDPGNGAGAGSEAAFILRAAGVTSNNPPLAADAVSDLVEAVGGYKDVNQLVNGDSGTTTHVEYEAGTPSRNGSIGEEYTGCVLDACNPQSDGANVYTGDERAKNVSITVHELAHMIDENTSRQGCWFFCDLGRGYPEERYDDRAYTGQSGNVLDPRKEHFADGVTRWVYGETVTAGQSYPLTAEQQEYLDTNLRGR